ncbi:hypothetical protein HYU10_03540 [Candidatus Woesearchaeota archaeon]|nr:hypothetical protein [Candidatus Woesearchaeota archaeon]MBI2661429.1 hypothetical protein [Candidatus Woesearchaeota archaeon]
MRITGGKKAESNMLFIALLVAAAVAISYFLGSAITAYVVKELSYSDDINLAVAASSEYEWSLQNKGRLKSLRIDGIATSFGNVKVYLENDGARYLVLDSSQINASQVQKIIETGVKQPEGNETEVKSPEENAEDKIGIRLKYNENSEYDTDNDGAESIYGVVDLSVQETSFSQEVNKSNLCTRWEAVSLEDLSSVQSCHGNEDCCGFVNLEAKREGWAEPYYATFGNDNIGHRNTISAQVIYTEFNTTGDEKYANTASSRWAGLNASFDEYYLQFPDACMETCRLNLENKSSYRLVFEIEGNATLTIKRINYEIDVNIVNNPPENTQALPNLSIEEGKSARIDLGDYFNDDDQLAYDYYISEGIDITFDGNDAVISAKEGFAGVAQTFITANDSEYFAVSNLFTINVTEKPEKTAVKPSNIFAVVDKEGKTVAWIDEGGNAYFTGAINDNAVIIPSPNSFVIQDSLHQNIALIDSDGDIYLKGSVEEDSLLEYSGRRFEVRSGANAAVAFIDESGNLRLKGRTHEKYILE